MVIAATVQQVCRREKNVRVCLGRLGVKHQVTYLLADAITEFATASNCWGVGIAQWLQCLDRDRKATGSSPGSAICADSQFGILPTLVLPQ